MNNPTTDAILISRCNHFLPFWVCPPAYVVSKYVSQCVKNGIKIKIYTKAINIRLFI